MQRPSVELVVAKTAKLRPALRRVTSARLSCSSSPKKVTPRLCCSLVNALSSSRTAHRLRLRSSPRTLTPSFLLSSKSLARFGCSLINALTTPRCRYQLFAVSRGQVENKGECRSDGRRVNMILSKKYTTYYFNPCSVRPSNARIVTVFTFKVADAAGAAALQFYRSGFLL